MTISAVPSAQLESTMSATAHPGTCRPPAASEQSAPAQPP
jgi:hypothetical protein